MKNNPFQAQHFIGMALFPSDKGGLPTVPACQQLEAVLLGGQSSGCSYVTSDGRVGQEQGFCILGLDAGRNYVATGEV